MSIHRTDRIGRGTAEQLILRGPAISSSAPEPLWTVLAAAAAPGRYDELAGEQAAVAAFREARLATALNARRPSMIQTALAKLLTVKIAAATIAATTLGGVALAAGTGALPTPGDQDKAPKPTQSKELVGSRGGASPSTSPKAEKPSTGTPSPSMVGLCKAYTAHPMDSRGKALESAAFTALVTAAGGGAKVGGYCTTVLAAASASPKAPTGKPTDTPADKPTDKATAKPTDGPTAPEQQPTAHPTGRPDQPGKDG